GENARGIGRAANLRLPDVQNATPGELAWFLRNGNLAAGMPSWSGLPPERCWQIVAYVKSLR
ncbi:MAG: c-type cytochrome, partial [Candidatus Binataceae bacterium]